MDRAIDLWSFYHPLPRSETSRHVVDRYVWRKHPELNPRNARSRPCRTQRWPLPTTDSGPSRVIVMESSSAKRRILEVSRPTTRSFSASCSNDSQRPCWGRRRSSSGFLPSHWMESTTRSVLRYSRTCRTWAGSLWTARKTGSVCSHWASTGTPSATRTSETYRVVLLHSLPLVDILVSFNGKKRISTMTDLGMIGANLCLPQGTVRIGCLRHPPWERTGAPGAGL